MLTRWTQLAILLVLGTTSCAARGQATAPAVLFDPAKHMRVSEVKAGMKGYGLSVFSGTAIDRFDVEVVSVLHNFNPKYDVVLIRCKGANLEHTGPVAGMSGSPIYLTDERGRSRLIGAFAYGWSLLKDPLAGVQPIEYMLEIGSTLKPESSATQPAGTLRAAPRSGLIRYSMVNPYAIWADWKDRNGSVISLAGDGDAPKLQPLATPLMTAGVSSRVLEQFNTIFRQHGLVALQAGGSVAAGPTTEPAAPLAPGSVMAAPLLTGDVQLTAIGTCTEILGDRVFGFGHPFNNEGPITLPMGSGRINAVIPTLSQSFKIGAITQLRGTLIADQSVGVAGKLGASPPTIPIDLQVSYTDGSIDTSYHFNAAAHPRLTPVLSALAVTAALSGRRDLPQYHTVEYDVQIEFANNQTLQVKDVAVNTADALVFAQMVAPIIMAVDNPFERVMLRKISGKVRITPEAHEADILSVGLPKLKYRPGEKVKAFVRYRPFRAGESILPIEFDLPTDLKDGTYEFTVSDRDTHVMQEEQAQPFRFAAESIEDVFAVIRDTNSYRRNALYLRMLRQSDGVAVGRTALPLLPSSRRQVLLDAGRSNITPFDSAVVKIVPTAIVMNGSADFAIEIDSQHHVEGATPRPARPQQPAP